MIGFLKRWFATKNEVESVYSQLDTIAHAIQELRKDQLMRRDEELNDWRPEPSNINVKLSPDAEKAFTAWRIDNLKARKLLAQPVVVEAPDRETLSRKIDEALKRSDNWVEAPDHNAQSPTSEHYARMSVRAKGTMENRLIDIASDRMRGIGCIDVYALRRRINEDTAHLCISSRPRSVKRSKGAKKARTYAGDMRFYDKRIINERGNNPEKTYSFRCEEERLLLMAYFDLHKVPYSTGRKQ